MKFIKDCTADELKQVFEVNSELQREIFNRMFDNAHYFRGYSIYEEICLTGGLKNGH